MTIASKDRIEVIGNFYLDELVHPDFYDGTRKAEKFLDRRIVEGLQAIRNYIDQPITVNNWAVGGKRKFNGLRPMNSAVGAKYSQHKFGRAFDLVVPGRTPEEIHDVIKQMEARFITTGRITRLENFSHTPTWTHIDNAYTGLDHLYFFNP
jgi:hypothetical protein